MKYLTLDLVKLHIKADDDTTEDALIELLTDAAEQSAVNYVNRSVYADQDELDAAVLDGTEGLDPLVITANMKAAMLLTVGHLYGNREAVVVGSGVVPHELPMGVKWLLGQDRLGPGV